MVRGWPMGVTKVLLYVEELNRGGVETFCMDLAEALPAYGCEASFLVLKSGSYDYDRRAAASGIPVHHLVDRVKAEGWRGRAERLRRYCAAMRTWMAQNGSSYDVVHVQASHLANMGPLMLAMRQGGCRSIVLHSHNSSEPGTANRALHHAFRAGLGLVRPEALLACSDVAGTWMFGRRGFEVIPNGVSFARFAYRPEARGLLRRELGLADDAHVLIYPARFSEAKNHRFLLCAMAIAHELDPSCTLLLCGRGETLEDVRRQRDELGLGDSVRLLGVRDDVDRLLSCSDACVFPSLYEGLPVSCVEAQAAGLPLLVSDGVSAQAILTGRARQLPLGAGERAWAEAMLAMTSGERQAAEADARLAAYDISRVAARMAQIYREASER